MAQIFALADTDNLTHNLVHLRHLCHIIRGIISTEHHQVHGSHTDAIMRLQHIAVEVLLQTVVIERGVGQVDAVQTHLPVKALCDRLSKGVHHLRAALPVVDRKLDGPLLAIGLDGIVVDELQEILFLFL